mmetsp:Transcript_348/g.678  ORF Transcript_348/g.678 Transcript_348/m.678 type:complete len:274 (+) Transcript_348:366-1187(+)
MLEGSAGGKTGAPGRACDALISCYRHHVADSHTARGPDVHAAQGEHPDRPARLPARPRGLAQPHPHGGQPRGEPTRADGRLQHGAGGALRPTGRHAALVDGAHGLRPKLGPRRSRLGQAHAAAGDPCLHEPAPGHRDARPFTKRLALLRPALFPKRSPDQGGADKVCFPAATQPVLANEQRGRPERSKEIRMVGCSPKSAVVGEVQQPEPAPSHERLGVGDLAAALALANAPGASCFGSFKGIGNWAAHRQPITSQLTRHACSRDSQAVKIDF